MMSMKMWDLLLLAAVLPIVPTVAEVVESVSDCDQFLLEAKPPDVPGILEGGNNLNQNRYKFICQTFDNERKFLTYYDTENKIPVYSAIKYRGEKETGRPHTYWKIEPQLENKDDKDKNMRDVDKKTTYINQAGDNDYKGNAHLTRGHLIASTYGFQMSDKSSTFTLTNIVPQEKTFNEGSWDRMEKCIKCIMKRHCINNKVTEAYVVTGALPSTTNTLFNTVNVPSKLWSAFCCFDSKKKKWIASAHWGENVPEKLSKKKSEMKTLPTKTLGELEQQLGIIAFPKTKCPDTVFFTNVDNCPCPRSTSTTSSRPT